MPKLKSGKPPRKIDNPEYIEWRRDQDRILGNYPDEDLFPEDYGKLLPEDGGWIIVLTEVKVGRRVDDQTILHITIPRLSCWFAVPMIMPRTGLHQAVVQSPEGSVHVFPHEYQTFNIEKFLEFTDEDGFCIHFLSESSGFNEEALFYLRTSGISKAEAQRMLLPSLKDPNYCYFTFAEHVREWFPPGFGTFYLTAENHRARAESAAQRRNHGKEDHR
jgi:hypothetical protein